MIAHPGDDLAALLRRVPAGGTLSLQPGEYWWSGELGVGDRRIVGSSADAVTLHGKVVLAGGSLRDVTVLGPADGNAVVSAAGGMGLYGCRVLMPSGATTAAVGGRGGEMVLEDCDIPEITDPAEDRAPASVVCLEHARLRMRDSKVGFVAVESGATASFQRCALSSLVVAGGGRAEAAGTLRLSPLPGKAPLKLLAQARLVVDTLEFRGPSPQAQVYGSSLRAEKIITDGGRSLVVFTDTESSIEGDTSRCLLVGDGLAPKEFTWLAVDGDRFTDVVLPRLQTGSVVRLEAGEYTADANNAGVEQLTLVGAGKDKTTLHTTCGFRVADGQALELEQMTMVQKNGVNLCNVEDGGTLVLSGIRIIPAQLQGDVPPIFAGRGQVKVTDSVFDGPLSRSLGTVHVVGGSLVSRRSLLGWVSLVSGANAVLDSDVLLGLRMKGSALRGTATVLSNYSGMRSFVLREGSTVDFSRLEILDSEADMLVSGSTLHVRECDHPESGTIGVDCKGEVSVIFDAAHLFIERDGVWETLREPLTGPRAAPTPAPAPTPAQNPTQPQNPAQPAASAPANPLAQLEELVGLRTVKRQVKAFLDAVQFAARRREAGLESDLPVMHSMFLGNPGTGKTTVARLVAQALHEAGAVRTSTFVEAGRADLVAEHVGGTAQKTNAVLESARGGVLLIDEAYDLAAQGNDFGQEAVNTILTFMENNREDIVIIFAGYPDMMQDFLAMNPGLKSRIPHRFDFEDYTPDELAEIAASSLRRKGYRFDADELAAAVRRQYKRSGDGSNGRWVRNVVERLTSALASRLISEHGGDLSQATAAELATITAEDLRAVAGGWDDTREEKVDRLLAELDALTGLDEVKRWAREMVALAEANQRMEAAGLEASRPTYHTVFAGNPGTGKTTVARVIAGLFHALGVLESPTVKEVTRADLVGAAVGETEKRTTRALDEALGGVLFIDEAYQLTSVGGNDFGQQAVETMLPRLENDREKFIAIFAGYTAEMDEFLEANPGLRSRVPNVIEFPDYSPADVAEIVAGILRGRGWRFDEARLRDAIAAVYGATPARERSNGRWARTTAERIEREHKLWIARHNPSGEELLHIAEESVVAGTL